MDQVDRRAANVAVSSRLLDEAEALGIDVARAFERGLADEVRGEKARRWQHENAAGFHAWNDYVDRNGIPLAKYRKF